MNQIPIIVGNIEEETVDVPVQMGKYSASIEKCWVNLKQSTSLQTIELNKFSIKQLIVTGPTPPGTGETKLAFS